MVSRGAAGSEVDRIQLASEGAAAEAGQREKAALPVILRQLAVELSIVTAALLAFFAPSYLLPSTSDALAASSASKGEVGMESGMSCATGKCARELQSCFTNPGCAKGMGCMFSCMGRADEGTCQVRCLDLHQNAQMDALTDCTLTKNGCYPPLKPDPKYPPVPVDAAQPDFDLQSTFKGKWLVAAGHNKAFDCFDCQEHDFYPVAGDGGSEGAARAVDATFKYRVKRDDGTWFTRSGDKRLTAVEDTGKQRGGPSGGHLRLTLRPDSMRYMDDWYVLASEPDAFIVVAYRGHNAAWDGYGGLNVYTRTGRLPDEADGEKLAKIRAGIEKVGLSLSDLTQIDNSCRAAGGPASGR